MKFEDFENIEDLIHKDSNMGKTKSGLVWQLRPLETMEGMEVILAVGMGGYANGYVGLPKGHPDYGREYEDIDVDVYGGLTYSEEKNGYWVVGFDVCHHGQNLKTWPKKRCMDQLMYLVEQLEKRFNVRQITDGVQKRSSN